MEAEPLAKITKAKVTDLVCKSIICMFELLRVLITNSGCQFLGFKFIEFYHDYDIVQYFTSVGHPSANGEAEVTNHTLLQGLKAMIDRAKGAWVDELHSILWAYQTT